jgi:uncharacterized oxidoreductase
MNLQDNTILITGGSSGIGLELARVLIEKGNKVLICGRSKQKLEEAKRKLPSVHTFSCNIALLSECEKLFEWVCTQYKECNVLINNAAIVHHTNFMEDDEMIGKADLEVQTNLMAPVILSKLFLPLLKKNKSSVIINITTGLVYAPRVTYPIYNATKAGLHAFTKVLRHQLKQTPVDVIEVMMSVVDTPWHKGNPPKSTITTEKAVAEMIVKLEKGQKEIRIDKVKLLYILSRIAPSFAFRIVNKL